jgi:hypothetical protein
VLLLVALAAIPETSARTIARERPDSRLAAKHVALEQSACLAQPPSKSGVLWGFSLDSRSGSRHFWRPTPATSVSDGGTGACQVRLKAMRSSA